METPLARIKGLEGTQTTGTYHNITQLVRRYVGKLDLLDRNRFSGCPVESL
jgi:hypothetical protein